MEITEEKLYAAFGLEPGGKEQEAADPAEDGAGQDSQDTEDNSQGSGTDGDAGEPETATEESDDHDAGNGGADQGEPDAGAGTEETADTQSAEERRANAARRRQQEQQDAIDSAVQKALEKRDAEFKAQQETFFKQAGLINPFTKTPITNMEEFEVWRVKQEEEKLQKELKAGRLTQETLNTLIERNPTVQAARQTQEEQNREAERQQEMAMAQEMERQLAEIRKTDPSINSLADLMNKPYGKEFYAAVKRGNNFVDAFYLATREQATTQTAEAARQSAMNNLNGKKHLKATSFGAKAGATVTDEEKRMFQLFNPDASEAEIQKYQNKYRKG